MVPDSSLLTIIYACLFVLVGGGIGLLAGAMTLYFTKLRQRLFQDFILGSAGFLVGELACALVPVASNTVTYRLSGGTEVTSTMNRYQHPERIAVLLAVLLPLSFEVYRLVRAQPSRAVCSLAPRK